MNIILLTAINADIVVIVNIYVINIMILTAINAHISKKNGNRSSSL